MLLQLEWHYLQRTVPGVGTLMCPIEEALREKIFPTLFGGEEINADFRKILGHSVKHGGSKAASGELVDSLLGGSSLNYVGDRACVRKASLAARRAKIHVELGELSGQKELAGGQ